MVGIYIKAVPPMQERLPRLFYLLLALCAFVLIITFAYNPKQIKTATLQNVEKSDETYLTKAKEEAFGSFLLLSGLKSSLSVLQSSEAGLSLIVDVNVQIGSFVDTMNEVVEVGWYAALMGLWSLEMLSTLLSLCELITPAITILLLLFLCLHFLLKSLNIPHTPWVRSAVYHSLYLSLLCSILIPFSIYCASLCSHLTTSSVHQEVRTQLEQKHGDLLLHSNQGSIKEQALHSAKRYKSAVHNLPKRHRHMTEQLLSHLVAITFDAFIFPVGFLLGLSYLAKRALFSRLRKTKKNFYKDSLTTMSSS